MSKPGGANSRECLFVGLFQKPIEAVIFNTLLEGILSREFCSVIYIQFNMSEVQFVRVSTPLPHLTSLENAVLGDVAVEIVVWD